MSKRMKTKFYHTVQQRIPKVQLETLCKRAIFFKTLPEWNSKSTSPLSSSSSSSSSLRCDKSNHFIDINIKVPLLPLRQSRNLSIPLNHWLFVLHLLLIGSIELFDSSFLNEKIPLHTIYQISAYFQTSFPIEYVCLHCTADNAGYVLSFVLQHYKEDDLICVNVIETVKFLSRLSKEAIFSKIGFPRRFCGRPLQKYIKYVQTKKEKFWRYESKPPVCHFCNIKMCYGLHPVEVDFMPCCYVPVHHKCFDVWLYNSLDIDPKCNTHPPSIMECLNKCDAIKWLNSSTINTKCPTCTTTYEYGVINIPSMFTRKMRIREDNFYGLSSAPRFHLQYPRCPWNNSQLFKQAFYEFGHEVDKEDLCNLLWPDS